LTYLSSGVLRKEDVEKAKKGKKKEKTGKKRGRTARQSNLAVFHCVYINDGRNGGKKSD